MVKCDPHWRGFFFLKKMYSRQTTALEGLPAVICLIQTAYSVETVWLFIVFLLLLSTKETASQKTSLLTHTRVDICRFLYTPNDNP